MRTDSIISKTNSWHSFIETIQVEPYSVPAHKVQEIKPLIESAGGKVLYQSPYSPEFNPIEHWWSQLKAFLRSFSPTTAQMVNILIATGLDLINPQHLKKRFTNCCYCTS